MPLFRNWSGRESTWRMPRNGGASGCVESGAFGTEAYILTGYFNLVKVLEITLHNGVDPRREKNRDVNPEIRLLSESSRI